MFTNDDWREALGNPGLTDAEVDAFRSDLRAFPNLFLEDYLRRASQDGQAL